MPYAPTFASMSDQGLREWLSYHIDAITAIARAERLDVLHANHEVPMAFVTHEVSRRTGIPYVVVAHGSTLEYVHGADERYAPLTCIGLQGADRVIALTTELRDRLLRICPAIAARLTVVATGVDLDLFHCEPAVLAGISPGSNDPPTVAYVGRMSLEKGVHALIASFPEVVKRVPDAQLRLIGDGPAMKSLTDMTAALAGGDLEGTERILRAHALPGKESWLAPVRAYWQGPMRGRARAAAANLGPESISFTGRLGPSQVAAQLRRARLVAVPSLIREAFPLVMLEGLASGAPPVSADHGGLSAVLDELEPALGSLGPKLRVAMQPSFVSSLADRIVEVLDMLQIPADRARESLRCRALAVDRYGWGRVAEDLEAQYRLAIASSVREASL
jgi:glycosyltransferase involved in cell wall biosynthesis